MFKKTTVVLLLMFISLTNSNVFAQATFGDKAISSTLKSLAKAYVATADINKLKAKYTQKLEKMGGDKFKDRFPNVYDLVKDLPDSMRQEYSILSNMTAQEAVVIAKKLNKNRIYQIIDAIPDETIISSFNEYALKAHDPTANEGMMSKINSVWKNVLMRIEEE